MKCFFAHPITDHGSAWKLEALDAIGRHLGSDVEIVDPDTPEHAAGYRARGMAYFEDVIAGCDVLVFARFPPPCGRVGAGVWTEVHTADGLGIPCWEVGRVSLRLTRCHPREDYLAWDALSADETRAKFRELRGRMAA